MVTMNNADPKEVLPGTAAKSIRVSNKWVAHVLTFLMVFVLNNAQSRDTAAINTKLDALINAIEKADNRLIGLEARPLSEADELVAEIQGMREDFTPSA